MTDEVKCACKNCGPQCGCAGRKPDADHCCCGPTCQCGPNCGCDAACNCKGGQR